MNNDLQYQYCDNNSILLVNSKGQIRRLYCPFKVQCIDPIDNIRFGIWVYVEEVKSSSKDQLLYLIHGQEYQHRHFCISIGF